MIQTEIGLAQSIELLAGQYRAVAELHRRIAPQSLANYRVLAEGSLEEIRRLQDDISRYLQVSAPRTTSEVKARAAVEIARECYSRNPIWIKFFHEVLGVDGIVSRLFATPKDLAEFEQSDEFMEIQSMLAALRPANAPAVVGIDPSDPLPASRSSSTARGTP